MIFQQQWTHVQLKLEDILVYNPELQNKCIWCGLGFSPFVKDLKQSIEHVCLKMYKYY